MSVLIIHRHNRKHTKQKMVGGAANKEAAIQLIKNDIAKREKKGKSNPSYIYQLSYLSNRGDGMYRMTREVMTQGGESTILQGVEDVYA